MMSARRHDEVMCSSKKGQPTTLFLKSVKLSIKPTDTLIYTINYQIWEGYFYKKGVPIFVASWPHHAHLGNLIRVRNSFCEK